MGQWPHNILLLVGIALDMALRRADIALALPAGAFVIAIIVFYTLRYRSLERRHRNRTR